MLVNTSTPPHNADKQRVCKFRSIHFETVFVYISFASQEYMVISVYCFEQDDDSK